MANQKEAFRLHDSPLTPMSSYKPYAPYSPRIYGGPTGTSVVLPQHGSNSGMVPSAPPMSRDTTTSSSLNNKISHYNRESHGMNAYFTAAPYSTTPNKELTVGNKPNGPSLRQMTPKRHQISLGKRILIALFVVITIVGVTLGIGLGVGVAHRPGNSDVSSNSLDYTATNTDTSSPTPSTKDVQMYMAAFDGMHLNLALNPRRIGWLDKFPVDRSACGADFDASVEGIGGCTLAQAIRGNTSVANAPVFYANGDSTGLYTLSVYTKCDVGGSREIGTGFTPYRPDYLAPPLVQPHEFDIEYHTGCAKYHVDVDIEQGGTHGGIIGDDTNTIYLGPKGENGVVSRVLLTYSSVNDDSLLYFTVYLGPIG